MPIIATTHTIQTIHTVISSIVYPTDLHTIPTIHTIPAIHAIHTKHTIDSKLTIHTKPTIHAKHTIHMKHTVHQIITYHTHHTHHAIYCHTYTTPPSHTPHHTPRTTHHHTTGGRAQGDRTTPPPHHRGRGGGWNAGPYISNLLYIAKTMGSNTKVPPRLTRSSPSNSEGASFQTRARRRLLSSLPLEPEGKGFNEWWVITWKWKVDMCQLKPYEPDDYMECNSHGGETLRQVHPCWCVNHTHSMLIKVAWFILVLYNQVLLCTYGTKPICLNFTARVV